MLPPPLPSPLPTPHTQKKNFTMSCNISAGPVSKNCISAMFTIKKGWNILTALVNSRKKHSFCNISSVAFWPEQTHCDTIFDCLIIYSFCPIWAVIRFFNRTPVSAVHTCITLVKQICLVEAYTWVWSWDQLLFQCNPREWITVFETEQ